MKWTFRSLVVWAFGSVAAADSTAPPTATALEAAVQQIEAMKQYAGEHVGAAGTAGETWRALTTIVAGGAAAEPALLRLARSQNPVARVAAAVGLSRLHPMHDYSPAARAVLEQLSRDHEKAVQLEGCIPVPEEVAKAALHVLEPPPFAVQIEAMSEYQGEHVGDAGAEGTTWRALSAIVASDGAEATLLRLARSKSPVARLAAIVGFERLRPRRDYSPATRDVLERLSRDGEQVPVVDGCERDRTTIAKAAQVALGRGKGPSRRRSQPSE
jgi:hypothetical protein